MDGVSVRDARALLDVAGAIEYDARLGTFTDPGLEALRQLLGADWVCYCERPITETYATVKNEVETRPFAGHNAEMETIFYAYQHEFPLHVRHTPHDGVALIGDVSTERAWRRTSFYNDWCRRVQIEPQATIVLAGAGSPVRRRVMIDLADDAERAFGRRERTILELIRPAFLRPLARIEAARQRHRALGLTTRELEVLGHVRHGLTNGEIAAELVVSPSTIRTHLENAFAKIGAHTRTEAIARLGEIGLPGGSISQGASPASRVGADGQRRAVRQAPPK